MIIGIQISCFFFALYVLQSYINAKVNAKEHRLLPLLMGVICLYLFLQIMSAITGERALMMHFKYFLLIYMLYFMLFYTLDFLHVQIPDTLNTLLFIMLLFENLTLFIEEVFRAQFFYLFVAFVVFFTFLIIGLATYAFIKSSLSSKENFVDKMIYLALIFPSLAMLSILTEGIVRDLAMPISLVFSCRIVLYLIKTERLTDTTTILQEGLFETSEMAFILFDTDFFYLKANLTAQHLFPKLLGKTRERTDESYKEMLQKLEARPNGKIEIELDKRYYECQLMPRYSAAKKRGYILSIYDITKEKKEVNNMKSMKKEADRQNFFKGRFLARMSHDLRSPMHSIIEISDILSKKNDIRGRNRSLVLYMKRAGESLLEIINSILIFSKLEAGKLELKNGEYNFEELLEELAGMSVINLQAKPIDFSVNFLNEHPRMLYGDKMQVREMIQNLLSNAVKYTEKGEIVCNITCTPKKDNKIKVLCSVKDTGRGMTKYQLEHVFDEFVSYQTDDKLEGAGLGLNIVKQLAKLMDGNAVARSNGENGATVEITFEQEILEEQCYPPVSFTKESLILQNPVEENYVHPNYIYPDAKILVVDDMKSNREIFSELVCPWRMQIDFAQNGEEAIKLVKENKYQLVFMDQIMPGMSGEETAKALHELQKDLCIIGVSSDISLIEEEKHYTDCIIKPFDRVDLQKIIETYIPERFQQEAARFEEMISWVATMHGKVESRKVYETFIMEIEHVLDHMEEVMKENMKQFQIKMHGIKGVCKQLGKFEMGELAEIMEMAAKTENISFLETHLEILIFDLQNLRKELLDELKNMPDEEEDMEQEKESLDETDLGIIWQQLYEGFESYDYIEIEEKLKQLEQTELSQEEQELYQKIKAYFLDFEYEAGSKYLKKYRGRKKSKNV